MIKIIISSILISYVTQLIIVNIFSNNYKHLIPFYYLFFWIKNIKFHFVNKKDMKILEDKNTDLKNLCELLSEEKQEYKDDYQNLYKKYKSLVQEYTEIRSKVNKINVKNESKKKIRMVNL